MENGKIKSRFDALVQNRKTLEQTYQVIEKFVVPYRGEFFKPMSEEQEVDWHRREIFDSTAIMACQTLASSMQGALTSPSTKWFTLSFRQTELKESNEAMRWLEECENKVYEALQDSDFNLEASEFYLDLSSYGCSVLVEEVDDESDTWQGIDFSAAPIVDVYFEMDQHGRVKILYRRLKLLPLQIMDKFGVEACPDWVIEAHEKAASTKIEMIFCVYARDDKKDADTSKFLAATERPFGCKYIFHKDAFMIGQEGGKYEMPAFIARFRKVAGSRWGHSPAFVCLSDILTLNQLTEETLEALGKVIDPSTIVTERGLLSDLDLGRGGLTVAKSKDDIWAYESRARFDVGELKIDRLQASINQAFFVDQLQLKESPAMTATEVQVRYELMQRLLGPTLGRLQQDFLDPLIQRTFNILARAKRLPPPPQVVIDLEAEYDAQYTGPLPRAQRMQVVESIQQFIGNIAGLAEIFPQVLDIPDMDEMAREVARLSGVPAKLIRDEAVVQEERDKRAQSEAKMQAAMQAQAEGQATKSLGEGAQAMDKATGMVQ
jgi:hypothetical protein